MFSLDSPIITHTVYNFPFGKQSINVTRSGNCFSLNYKRSRYQLLPRIMVMVNQAIFANVASIFSSECVFRLKINPDIKEEEDGARATLFVSFAFEDWKKNYTSLVFLIIRFNDYRDTKRCRLGFQSKRKGFTARRSASPTRIISYFLL